MRKINFYTTLVLTCLQLCLISCNDTGNSSSQKNIVCFIDFSETPDLSSRMQQMKDLVLNNIVGKLSYETSITILPLDKASASGSEELLSGRTLEEFDYIPDMTAPADEEKIARENLQKTRDSLKQAFSQHFDQALQKRSGLQKGTDVFGALAQAKRYLPAGQNNKIILLSDMMNWSETLKMEPGSFTQNSMNSALEKAPASNLQNTTVVVYTGSASHLPAAHYNLVKQFWEKYFSREQLQLADYSSGALTKLEEIVNE